MYTKKTRKSTRIGEYITKMYDGCRTSIMCKNRETLTVDLLRGVKQGDPLSPLLFNLAVDPIIQDIDETTEGVKLGDENVSITAFADDLVLIGKDQNEAPNAPLLGTLDRLDQEIRTIIKKILRLHPSTTDGLIYTDKSHGDQGVPRMANIVKLAKLRSLTKMGNSTDAAVRQACLGQEGIAKKYAASMGLEWPTCHGVREFFGDKVGNAWLYTPELLKASRYLDALKLRTNTFGTRVAMKRAKKEIDYTCKRCGTQAETLGHILGNCTHSEPMRIKSQGPDLVIKDQDRVYVVDVTVRYEYKENLRDAEREKKRKGAMPKDTKENMKVLGLKANHMLTVSLIALRSSIEMANQFIDYDYTV
ncbi:PREDICTED: uncharacterized protein LOC108575978 [Habropoda laboriosa]|uniref:uncharacterized protein LOC108575978 n=1 Tax=Habropoda laboriosa TaxID=597456 RepID=UPI00083DF03F|nr:PREDICTED: uncharacterized protein LOC108575978 [Habropoda laboriosa]